MTRVLFWCDLFWPYLGGIESQAAALLPSLRRCGFEIAIVTSHRNLDLPDVEQWQSMTIRRFPFRRVLESRDIVGLVETRRAVQAFVDGFDPHIVHVNGIGPAAALLGSVANLDRASLLVSLHQELFSSQRGGDSMLADLLKRADWVHAVTPWVLHQARELVPSIGSRSSVIYNFVDAPAAVPPSAFEPARLLCLGRLVPQKGFDIALEAFALLAESHPRTVLTLAGDGEERPRLEAQAHSLGIASRVEFTGWIDPVDVPPLMAASNIIIMPSRREGFGLVAAEAAATARPVVASRTGGLLDVVEDGITGILVDPGDAQALARALVALIDAPDRARALGEAARVRAVDLFDRATCMERHEALYRHLARTARC